MKLTTKYEVGQTVRQGTKDSRQLRAEAIELDEAAQELRAIIGYPNRQIAALASAAQRKRAKAKRYELAVGN